jgi:hypothetical protein
MRGAGIVIVLSVLSCALPACRACASTTDDAKTTLSPGLAVPVERDGRTLVTIDQPLLDRTKADYVDGDRKAWRLSSLVGGAPDAGPFDPHVIVEVEDAEGVRTVLAGGGDLGAGRELVVTVNRAGALRVAVTVDDDIFGAFHGRGGNRGRAGDPTRVREVRHIWLTTEG